MHIRTSSLQPAPRSVHCYHDLGCPLFARVASAVGGGARARPVMYAVDATVSVACNCSATAMGERRRLRRRHARCGKDTSQCIDDSAHYWWWRRWPHDAGNRHVSWQCDDSRLRVLRRGQRLLPIRLLFRPAQLGPLCVLRRQLQRQRVFGHWHWHNARAIGDSLRVAKHTVRLESRLHAYGDAAVLASWRGVRRLTGNITTIFFSGGSLRRHSRPRYLYCQWHRSAKHYGRRRRCSDAGRHVPARRLYRRFLLHDRCKFRLAI